MKIQAHQIKQIQTVFSRDLQISDRDMRLDIISDYVGRPIRSTKDLTEDEASGLLYLLGRENKSIHTYHAHFDYSNGQHRYILSLCYQLNWTVWSDKAKKMVVDQERLGKFIMSNKSPVRKPLNKMDKKELSKIIYVLEKL